MTNQEIVAKLWNLCNVLRDDGITYHQYVTKLTYILFLKMAKKLGRKVVLLKIIDGMFLQVKMELNKRSSMKNYSLSLVKNVLVVFRKFMLVQEVTLKNQPKKKAWGIYMNFCWKRTRMRRNRVLVNILRLEC